jgi:tetratricopeptide (TPR) repeat protein
MQRDINLVVQTLKNAKDRQRGCSLLIGAGCSVKAGIPVASKFTEIIQERFPESYKMAKQKAYPQCMAELSLGERRDLIGDFVDKANINWAHICIAQLIKHGYIDRVLTVNFDPLVVRACALLGVFPAVYDFAASQRFKPADIPDQAVFYLHGQRSGFVLLNTESEVKELSNHLEPVFSDAARGRTWLVVGYSGANDPVFEHLAQIERFDHRLFWVCYKDEDPPAHVREKILVPGKDAYYVKGFDADDFFVTLAQKLGHFPPDLVGKPFSHLEQLITMLTPYNLPGQASTIDVTSGTMKQIREAIERHGETPQAEARAVEQIRSGTTQETSAEKASETAAALSRKALELIMAGDYDAVVALRPEYDKNPTPELAENLARAYSVQGSRLYDQAEAASDGEAKLLLDQAIEKFKIALEIKPNYDVALNDCGIAIAERAKFESGEDAERLIATAIDKFKAAFELNKYDSDALNNWGFSLYKLAKLKSDEEADGLFSTAYEKYKAALRINPNYYYAFDSWGTTLAEQAKRSVGDDRERLYALAYEKFEAAVKLQPYHHIALTNWAGALVEHAKTKSGEEAERLLALAEEKREAARRIKSPSS